MVLLPACCPHMPTPKKTTLQESRRGVFRPGPCLGMGQNERSRGSFVSVSGSSRKNHHAGHGSSLTIVHQNESPAGIVENDAAVSQGDGPGQVRQGTMEATDDVSGRNVVPAFLDPCQNAVESYLGRSV